MKAITIIRSAFLLRSACIILLIQGIYSTVKAQTGDPAQDAHIESNVKKFLKVLNSGTGKPIEELSPLNARAVLASVQTSVKTNLSGITIMKKTIVAGGQSIKLDIVKPSNTRGILPVFMFFHGGGWVLGDFPTHERIVRDIVVASGAAAVFVNYAPSPEAHFPVAIEQAYAATKWVASHGSEIGVNGKRLAVAGNSVGGNMAAVVSILAKERKGPKIKLQVMLWPVVDADFETESFNSFGSGRFLSKPAMMWFWDNYAPDLNDRKNIHASPLLANQDQLTGLPPALIEVAEEDILRDAAESYGRKLDEAGVPVVSIRFNGMIHDWGLLNPLAYVPATQSALLFAGVQLKRALAK